MPSRWDAFPLPSPNPVLPVSASRSSRVRARVRRQRLHRLLLREAVFSLNFLSSATDIPGGRPAAVPSTSVSMVSATRAVSAFLARADLERVQLFPCGVSSPAAVAFSSYASAEAHLRDAAVPLDPRLVSLPGPPRPVDILALLPPDIARRYSQPEGLLRVAPVARCSPALFRVASPRAYADFVVELQARDMVVFRESAKATCGIFAVPKGDKQRFIVDGRPANALLVDAPHFDLAGPDVLSSLVADEPFEVATCDLDNFFHRLRTPEWMWDFYALPPLPACDVGLAGPGVVFPCLTTACMGATHSAYLSQMVHETIAARASIPRDALVVPGADVRLDRLRAWVYIDDLGLVAPARLGLVAPALSRYIDATTDADLPPKASKIRAASTGPVQSLGLVFHGTTGLVAVAAHVLLALAADTRAMASRPSASPHEIQCLVGRWVWAMLVCRPALSVLHHAFSFQALALPRQSRPLWPSLRAELRAAAGLVPFLVSDLRRPLPGSFYASDASSTGLGVTVSPLPPAMAWSFLAASTQRHVTVAARRASAPNCLLLPWVTIVSTTVDDDAHINLSELRAFASMLRLAVDSGLSRVVCLVDSQVVAAVVSKGRSASFPLLCVLRRIAARLLLFGCRVVSVWVPSELNPADAPSRTS